MARHRLQAAGLARVFDSATQPLYVLNDELEIVFCNQALGTWFGRTVEELIGRKCLYHSAGDPQSIDAVASELCPPPSVSCGQEATACLSRIDPRGTIVYREVRFIPLAASSQDLIAVIGLVGSEDLADPPVLPEAGAGGETSLSIALHEQVRAVRRRTSMRHSLERLVGTSPAIRRARAQAELASRSRVSVLLIGPPGSGREHIAAAIHYGATPESAGMLVPLACSLLGAELIHSTVNALAAGKPSVSESGPCTLLLNDADRLPLEVQAELARIFSSRTFPLRLIAAAEQSLDELARRGRYREDLAAVLGTLAIELPPLAQRREDIPLLAQALIEEINALGGKQVAGFGPGALDQLDGYAWPGNVDELAKVMAESHRRAAGPEIARGDLPERLRLAADAAARPRRKEETIVLDEFLQRIERELIRRAVARSRGNKAKAARLLGLTRSRLGRRMVQLGLEEEVP